MKTILISNIRFIFAVLCVSIQLHSQTLPGSYKITLEDYVYFGYLGEVYFVSPEIEQNYSKIANSRTTLTNEYLTYQKLLQQGIKRNGYYILNTDQTDWYAGGIADQDLDIKKLNEKYLSNINRKVYRYCEQNATIMDAQIKAKDYTIELIALAITRARAFFKHEKSLYTIKSDYLCYWQNINYQIKYLLSRNTSSLSNEDLTAITDQESNRINSNTLIQGFEYNNLYFWQQPVVNLISANAWEDDERLATINIAGAFVSGIFELLRTNEFKQKANSVLKELQELNPIPYSKTPKIYYITERISGNLNLSLQKGLVAYYPFNGNANDESNFGHSGIIQGASLTTDRFGKNNNALFFDGVNDYVALPQLWNPAISALTISFWFNFSQFFDVGSGTLFYHGNGGEIHLRIKSKAKGFEAGIKLQTNQWQMANTAITIDQWNHCLILWSKGNEFDIFINNVHLITQKIPNEFLFDPGERFSASLGSFSRNQPGDASNYKGKIDDIRIYDRVLSLQEINVLYHEGSWKGK